MRFQNISAAHLVTVHGLGGYNFLFVKRNIKYDFFFKVVFQIFNYIKFKCICKVHIKNEKLSVPPTLTSNIPSTNIL